MIKLFLLLAIIFLLVVFIWQLKRFLARDKKEEELEEVNDDVIEEVFARVIQRLTKETKSNKK